MTAAQHSTSGTAMGMHGFQAGATTVNIPLLRNSGGWTGALVIQNLSDGSVNVTVRCYNTGGAEVSSFQQNIAAHYSVELLPPTLPSIEGSVTITSPPPNNYPIGVYVQQSISNDHSYGYAQP